jgi:hypothetical protein
MYLYSEYLKQNGLTLNKNSLMQISTPYKDWYKNTSMLDT